MLALFVVPGLVLAVIIAVAIGIDLLISAAIIVGIVGLVLLASAAI